MRSIRRSLLGYLLLLLALALSAVGALVDRFANAAIHRREESEENRINETFKVRKIEAKAKFDADLLAETRSLAKDVHSKVGDLLGQKLDQRKGPGSRPPEPHAPLKAPEEEAKQYRLRSGLMGLATPPTLAPTLATLFELEPRFPSASERATFGDRAAFNDPRKYNPAPHWADYDAPRAVARIQESLRREFEEEGRRTYFHITLIATYYSSRAPRTVVGIHSTKLGADLPFDPAWLEQGRDLELRADTLDIPNNGTFHWVATAAGVYGSPIRFGLFLPGPPAASVPAAFAHWYPAYPFRGPDAGLRVFVHHARPQSELDARLATDQKERDDQLARVRAETQLELSALRARLTVIGATTFAALVLGGWFFVARGLAPLHTLSDAVSRVSEKDFRLPVGAEGLGRELAPIHARITQTLTLLQRAFAREKQAVADISHELRTPIASLLATIDVALRKDRTPEQYREALKECRLISKQLGQLVERIMTLASLDAGNDHTQVARVDAGELALGCAAVVRPLAAANTITLAVRVEDGVTIDTDAGKLREVLMNLLHNAVEYNRPDGTIEFAARRDGETAVFEVRDTGIGMGDDVKERIFERFYRADSSRHATGIHAGLGLAIVKEYVSRLNGSIAVESEPGAGTTFRVTLPAPLDPESADRPKIRNAAPVAS